MPLRLAFMGTPDFAVPTLRALADVGHDIAAVYTQPPRPAGRGQKERLPAVGAAAQALGMPVRWPASLKTPEAQADFAALALDAAVVVAYGLILPKPILDAPRLGCINLHASLLPRWRGAAPINRAIMAGDAHSGVCTMQMDEGLDTGGVLLCERLAIGPRMTAGDLHDRLAAIGAPLMVRTLSDIAAGRLCATPQPAGGVTYAAKIAKGEGRIDWMKNADEIDRQIRGLSPFPGTFFEAPDKRGQKRRIRIIAARPEDGAGAPGEVLAGEGLRIACGRGALVLEILQREGGAPAAAGDFLNGFPLPPGMRLD